MHLLREGLLWLDADAVRFWSLAWICLGLTAWAAWRTPSAPPATGWRWDTMLFAFGVPLSLAAFRWPAWFFPTELNPDESQTIAGAITLIQNPVYWKSVDGTTHGPLCEYPLVLAGWLGAPMNYVTARIIGTAMQAGSILASWGALRCCFGDRVARLATLPALVFWCCVTWDDFVHYSSEVPGLFFLSLGAWLAAWAILPASAGKWRRCLRAGLAGFCLGAVPFAKLQVVPLALVIGLLSCGVAWRRFAGTDRWRLLLYLIGGALIPAAFVAICLTIYGLWGHFLPSYIVSNFAYVGVGQHLPLHMPGQFFNFSATEPAFAWFFWGSLLYGVFYARGLAAFTREKALCWGLLGLAFYCVFRPGREAAHYLQLLVWPLTLITGATLAAAVDLRDGKLSPAGRLAPFLWLGLFALLPQVYHRAVSWHRFTGHLAQHLQPHSSPAVVFLQQHTQPGDTMAMWGWESSLLVSTGLAHGTREAHTANLFVNWSLRDYFTNRYLWDMERHRPVWFVDAVGPGAFMYDNRTAMGHETVPRLQVLIASDYALVAEFDNKRIYRLKTAAGP